MASGIIRVIFKQVDQPSDELKKGADAAGQLREFIFNSIESVVVLAALELALEKNEAQWLWVVYLTAWIALALYLLTHAKYMVSRLTENFKWATTHREKYLWAVGMISVITSVAITYILPALTAEFIRVNFSGSP